MSKTYGQWLRLQRQAHGWSVQQMGRKLREAATEAGDRLPNKDCLVVMIYRWEGDRSGIGERYRLYYCKALRIPFDRFGDAAIPDVQHADRVEGNVSAIDREPAGEATLRLCRLSFACGADEPALRAQSIYGQLQVALDQIGDLDDRPGPCFLLGYLSAIITGVKGCHLMTPDPGELA